MNYYQKCVDLLNERGVTLDDIADCVHYLQHKYMDLTEEDILDSVKSVLNKREVQNVVITGITMDKLTDANALQDDDLVALLKSDYPLYGVDEVLAYGICNIYGSIALTNFGFIDKDKPLIIKKLNDAKKDGISHTFLDDIVGAIAASAASRLAHGDRE